MLSLPFFFLEFGDIALWLGPYMSIICQNYICTRTQKIHKYRQIKSHQITPKTHNQDDFVKKNSKPDNKGARAQTTKATKWIAKGHSGLYHCVTLKNMHKN
jgi:hypothetical protein